jgi:hypothetical protein
LRRLLEYKLTRQACERVRMSPCLMLYAQLSSRPDEGVVLMPRLAVLGPYTENVTVQERTEPQPIFTHALSLPAPDYLGSLRGPVAGGCG